MKRIFLPIIACVFLFACNNKLTTKGKSNTMSFKKADWIHNTDVYEVNLRQYTQEGTFNAFAKELPRLKEMGVSTLWFMPITPISKKEMKGSMGSYYACSDYTSINPEFGTLDDFKVLVKKAHEMGMKVIIDWVANHTGWDHVWTKSNPEYYEIDSTTNDFKRASGMDDIIELDFTNKGLRKAMIDAMQYWVKECDIDGYRCDLAFWVELDFWVEARAALEKTKTLFWLAENDAIDNPHYYQAFDACYSWTWMHKTEDFYKKDQNKKMLDGILQQYDTAGGANAIKLWFTTNHDENTWNGTEYEKYGDAAKALAVFSFTWDGIPLIYSGQELPNHKRLKFFDKDVIEWTGKFEMEDFYKTLLSIHKNNPALRAGDPAVTTYILQSNADNNVLAFLRKNGNNEVLVLLNLSKEKVDCTINDAHLSGTFTDVFHNLSFNFGNTQHFALSPWQYLVYEKKISR
ncbi:alpha-amylase family glycosyl hydrolase [Ferruginibacter sp. SUN002]|uniref:alpha-amylase family glycosyl hydrolase n=1 Tax=Ferruginibacter sp. SUN002 TaxID=2937789 RepID=UPI003D36C57F